MVPGISSSEAQLGTRANHLLKYKGAPFVKRLQSENIFFLLESASATSLPPLPFGPNDHRQDVLQRCTIFGRQGHVFRGAYQLRSSHGRVITSSACQVKTLHDGVIIDAGRRLGGQNPTREDDFWLHLYVMLSRATDLDDILLTRAPPVEFLLKGPPESLARTLRTFAARTNSCGLEARRLAAELGLQDLLRD